MLPDKKLSRSDISRGITQAYLLGLNRYALDQNLITPTEYQKMENAIRTDYSRALAKVKLPNTE